MTVIPKPTEIDTTFPINNGKRLPVDDGLIVLRVQKVVSVAGSVLEIHYGLDKALV